MASVMKVVALIPLPEAFMAQAERIVEAKDAIAAFTDAVAKFNATVETVVFTPKPRPPKPPAAPAPTGEATTGEGGA